MRKIPKIVSGGQTGADRAALDWALSHNLPCGGWCQKGRKAEDGTIDLKYPLKESSSASYLQRTEWPVRTGRRTRLYCRHPRSLRCTRSSLFHLHSQHRSGRSYGLAGFSPAARGFGSNGDRANGAGTGRQDQTDRGGTNCVGSNSEGIGTSGRGACPGQDSCQGAKLIRVSRANSDIPYSLAQHPNFGKRSF
jgi:hypothetical protein